MTPRTRLAVGATLAATFLGYLVRPNRTLPGEIALTEMLNPLSGALNDVLDLVMQLGARPAIVVIAVAAAVVAPRRPVRTALVVAACGALAWGGAVVLKEVVDRPRPAALGADVEVGEALDSPAWPSSHVAVATASLAGAALATGRSRLGAALVVGAVVGVARMTIGVHLWADVAGGLLIALVATVLVVEIADRSVP